MEHIINEMQHNTQAVPKDRNNYAPDNSEEQEQNTVTHQRYQKEHQVKNNFSANLLYEENLGFIST